MPTQKHIALCQVDICSFVVITSILKKQNFGSRCKLGTTIVFYGVGGAQDEMFVISSIRDSAQYNVVSLTIFYYSISTFINFFHPFSKLLYSSKIFCGRPKEV